MITLVTTGVNRINGTDSKNLKAYGYGLYLMHSENKAKLFTPRIYTDIQERDEAAMRIARKLKLKKIIIEVKGVCLK